MEMVIGCRSSMRAYGRPNFVRLGTVECHQLASRTATKEETTLPQVPVTVVSCCCTRVAMDTEYARRALLAAVDVSSDLPYLVQRCTSTAVRTPLLLGATWAGWTRIACTVRAWPIFLFSYLPQSSSCSSCLPGNGSAIPGTTAAVQLE